MVAKIAFGLMSLLVPVASAIPSISGFNVRWGDDFDGPAGAAIDSNAWYVQGKDVGKKNGEVQFYNNENTKNLHLSGDGQLYILPYRDHQPNNGWSSGRVHSKNYWTPAPGKVTIYRAEIWVPDFTNAPSTTDGLWPAFWTKGNNNRDGQNVNWPKCGEWDILEVSPRLRNENQGTLHYADANNATKHLSKGGGKTVYTGGQYHTWSFKVDRTSSNVNEHFLQWLKDGTPWQTITRANFGDGATAWADLATKPYYIILNVAIGGGFTNPPSDNTLEGYANSMRVKYVAVYESN